MPPVTPDLLRAAVAASHAALAPHQDADWTVPAGDLDWDCRRTLDHLSNVFLFYALHLASRAETRLSLTYAQDRATSLPAGFAAVAATAAVLAAVARAAPPHARGYHPAGMADAEGFLAMAVTETLVHTHDIAQGLGQPFAPPTALVGPVLARIFPWFPPDAPAWPAFLWLTGRASLGDRPRLGPDWYWHCAPLAEWDGKPKFRTAPPAWT